MTIGELTDKIQNVIDDSELGLWITHSEMGGKEMENGANIFQNFPSL